MSNKKILICAEIGHNFNGSIRLAKEMIKEAKSCGADIAKFQLYQTEKIKKPYQSRYFELKAAELTYLDAQELWNECKNIGIEFMASVFDKERVKWCEDIGVKRYKIASRSIYNTELIKAVEKTKKPIIASLGTWKEKEFPKIKNAEFLYCVSEYPAYITNDTFPTKFDKYTGFSDHTTSCYWAREAIKRGATIIEKHFTLSKTLPGHNQKGSAEPWEMKDLVAFARQHERGVLY